VIAQGQSAGAGCFMGAGRLTLPPAYCGIGSWGVLEGAVSENEGDHLIGLPGLGAF